MFLRTFMKYFSLYIGTDLYINSHTLWGSLYFLFLWKQLPVKKTKPKQRVACEVATTSAPCTMLSFL